MKQYVLAGLVCLLTAATVVAQNLTLTGDPVQGGLVQGRTVPGATVSLDAVEIPVAKSGLFALGFGRDAGPAALLVVRLPDGEVEQRRLAVRQRDYKVQRIDGLPGRKVSPSKADMKRIVAERKLLQAARRVISGDPAFAGGFAWPVTGRISGIYGSQRILNGKPRRPHFGVDIAAPEGTPIVAAADGRVVLIHHDMFFTGKTVMIDHGLGVGTIYIHMSAIEVGKGDVVRRGQRIGKVGMTGRATGPHLHWGLTWRGISLDPALVAGPMPQPEKKN
jgi:murein DD-endopeptidase MepM/ murein hydrolase activator NlpD